MPYSYGNYIPAKERKNIPRDVYMQVVYILKDYRRMLRERDNILYGSMPHDGQPRGSGTGDPTGSKAVRLAALSSRIDGIDQAVFESNVAYGQSEKHKDSTGFDSLQAFEDYGYFCYMLYDPETGREPSTRTWKRFRAKFACKVAQNLNLI